MAGQLQMFLQSCFFTSVLGWTKRGEGNLYCRIKMFHLQSEVGVKAGEGYKPPPPCRLLQSPVPWGSMSLSGFVLCGCSLTPRLHYGWDDADIQSPCVTPQDTACSVSINVLWKPCRTVCPPNNSINAQPFTARGCTLVPALNVEMTEMVRELHIYCNLFKIKGKQNADLVVIYGFWIRLCYPVAHYATSLDVCCSS